MIDFEWDPEKAERNLKDHGVSFVEAAEVFGDILSSAIDDPDHSHDEARLLIFGQSLAPRYLVVSFTERGGRIRIISAREMTRSERNAYEQ